MKLLICGNTRGNSLALTPIQVKRVLMDTAKRLPDVNVDRQGWGVVQPAAAVKRALEKRV